MVSETQLAILFADVCGSTKLYDTIGDVKARETVAQCVSIMTASTEKVGGTLIKTIGDEVMVTFKTADDACTAAQEMQEMITNGLVVEGRSVAIRIGFHYGPALLEKGDVFGDAVNLAARMAGQAKAGQILTTDTTVKAMSDLWEASTRQIDRAAIKGKKQEIEVFEVQWEQEDVTRMATGFSTQSTVTEVRMVLQYQGQQTEVGDDHPVAVLGRSEQSDIIVKVNLISRLHARVEYRKGNFILTDQSINGTYVTNDNGEETFVRRDNAPIKGNGVIGLGKAMELDSPDAIKFTYVE